MNLQQLRVFLKVAELEHITHASEDLGFSQPAVTKMVQSLEQEIGLELIKRRKKGVALTTMTEDDEDVARPMASTTTGATKHVVYPPAPKDWFDRVSAQCARNEDL